MWWCPKKISFLLSQMKNNANQICWLLEKVPRSSGSLNRFSTFQQFLDSQQYTSRGILRYEKMFGAGYVSTGGVSTTKVRSWGNISLQYVHLIWSIRITGGANQLKINHLVSSFIWINLLFVPTGVCRYANPQTRTEGFRCWLWHRWGRLLHGQGNQCGGG